MSEHRHEQHGEVDKADAILDEQVEQVDEQLDEPVVEQVDEQVDELPAERPAVGETPGADPRIAAAVERLDGLDDHPPAEHLEVYEDVHFVLQESLAEAAGERQNP